MFSIAVLTRGPLVLTVRRQNFGPTDWIVLEAQPGTHIIWDSRVTPKYWEIILLFDWDHNGIFFSSIDKQSNTKAISFFYSQTKNNVICLNCGLIRRNQFDKNKFAEINLFFFETRLSSFFLRKYTCQLGSPKKILPHWYLPTRSECMVHYVFWSHKWW